MKKYMLNAILFFMLFAAIFSLCALIWINKNYGIITFYQLIFHLNTPLVGANPNYFYTFFGFVIAPSLILSALGLFYRKIFWILFVIFIYFYIFGISVGLNNWLDFKALVFFNRLQNFYNDNILFEFDLLSVFYLLFFGLIALVLFGSIKRGFCAIGNRIMASFCLFILGFGIANNQWKIAQIALISPQYDTFIESHYAPFYKLENKQKRNLILILAESFEALPEQYQNGGYSNILANGSNAKELTPNLYRLNEVNFSRTSGFGGHLQTPNTGWTIAGTVAYLCGFSIGYNFPINLNVKCLGDILKEAGYDSLALLGYYGSFSHTNTFLNNQAIKVLDLDDYKDFDKQTMGGFWGLKEYFIFEWAKEQLNEIKPPFALIIPTIDTHSRSGFVDRKHCKEFLGIANDPIFDAFKCSDKIISSFINWAKKQDFYKNTTIVILGDHLFYGSDPSEMMIFNSFINAKFSRKISDEIIKNRLLSHHDMGVLVLDSIGFEVVEFGLGRNPLYARTLLEIYGDDFYNRILNPSIMFNEKFFK